MGDEQQKRTLDLSAGTVSLALAVTGGVLLTICRNARTIQDEAISSLLLKGFGLGEVLVMVAAVVGMYAIIKNDGRIQGFLALGPFGILVLWFLRLLK